MERMDPVELSPLGYQHVLRAIFETPWAILPSHLAIITDVIRSRAVGMVLSAEEVNERLMEAAQKQGPRLYNGQRAGTVGVIPIYGTLIKRAGMTAKTSGGTSVDSVTRAFREAMADTEISAVVLDVDSPGGSVDGISELASEIRASRGQKPIVAVANTMAASAAYWLASAADEIVASPSAIVGSIGVIAAHQDLSAKMEMEGVKTTLIKAGRYKGEANEFTPLEPEALAAIQADVDHYYGMFTADVAKGRKVSVETVRGAAYGEGRTVVARKALESGMVDRIATLDETIARLARGGARVIDGQSPAGLVSDGSVNAEAPHGVLGSGATLAEQLMAGSAGLTVLVREARERAEIRAKDGRPLAEGIREGLERVVALGKEAGEVVASEPADPPAEAPRRVNVAAQLAAFEIASRGY